MCLCMYTIFVCVCVCESMCMDVYVKVYVCTSVYLCVFLCMCGLLAHSPVTSCPLMVAWLEQTAPIARTVMLKLSPHVRPLSSQLVSDVWHSSSRPIAPSATAWYHSAPADCCHDNRAVLDSQSISDSMWRGRQGATDVIQYRC